MIDLRPLLPHIVPWLLVLTRLSGVFVLAPVLSSTAIPRMVKVLLAVALSLCIYPLVLTTGGFSETASFNILTMSLWTLAPAVGTELLLGYLMGYALSLPMAAMQGGGHLIDQQMGLGIAGVFNPELGEQSSPVGDLLFMVAMAVFLIVGGHLVMLRTLAESFHHLPLAGRVDAGGLEGMLVLVTGLLQVMLELAVRVAAPMLCLVFLETVAMGFIARTVPQLNILSIGFVVRIVLGFAFLAAYAHAVMTVYLDTLVEMMGRVAGFLAG